MDLDQAVNPKIFCSTRKPPRMRSACTACHTAKVKCTGQRSGCTRCRSYNLPCEYEVSMVGRMSTKRSSRKDKNPEKLNQSRQQSPQRQTGEQEETSLEQAAPASHDSSISQSPPTDIRPSLDDSPITASLARPVTQPPASQHPTAPLPTNMVDAVFQDFSSFNNSPASSSFINDLHDVDFSEAFVSSDMSTMDLGATISYPTDFEPPTNQTMSMPFLVPENHKDLPDLAYSSSATPTGTLSSRGSEPLHNKPPSTHLEQRHKVAEQYHENPMAGQFTHVTTLMGIISALEVSVQIGNLQLDSALDLNRDSLTQVRQVMTTDAFHSCFSCLGLIATALDLMLGRYGILISTLQKQASKLNEAGMSLDIDPDAVSHQSWQSFIPSENELAQPSDAHNSDSMKTMLDFGNSGSVSTSAAPRMTFGCFELDTEQQIMFRNAIIRKELKQFVQVARTCVHRRKEKRGSITSVSSSNGSPNGKGGLGSSMSSSNGRLWVRWLADLEARATQLLTFV